MSDKCPQCGEQYNRVGQHMSHPHSDCEFTKEVLIDELQRLADELGESPSTSDMNESGKYDKNTYQNYFGSWNDALKEGELELNVEKSIGEDRLLEELQRLAEELGKTPSKFNMKESGKFSSDTYRRNFGSWNEALEEAGLELNKEENIGEDRLLEELQRLADELDRTPSAVDMLERGIFSRKTYERNFGSWNEALKEAGLELNKEENIGEDRLLEELQRLADELGKTPTGMVMNESGKYDKKTYQNYFGSWNDALKEAGFDPVVEYPIEPEWADDVEDYYGESWPEKREEAVERDDHECRVCGSDGLLQVHHITPRRMFEYPDDSNTLDNLVTLCNSCHGTFEGHWVDADVEIFVENARNAYGPEEQTVQTELEEKVLA